MIPPLMKALVIAALVAVAIVFFAFLRLRSQSGTAAKSSNAYAGLRDQILHGSRARFGLPPANKPNEPWGVVMDWGVTHGTATVIALSDGTASIYLSSGGGHIGGQGQESIRNAAKNAIAEAAEAQTHALPTSEYPLPGRGEVIFYFLTDSGVFSAKVTEAELQGQNHPLLKLGNRMQEIITQYRLFEQKRQSAN